jgi:DNA-binding transcriptional regulator/RsmH inhibitor MraZ
MLPARWRAAGAPTTLVLVQWPVGMDLHLLALRPERWAEMHAGLCKKSLSDEDATVLLRQIGSTHAVVSLDSVGRLPIPEQQARMAGIGEEAEFFGLLDRFEVWDPARYAAIEGENKRRAAEAFRKIAL